MKTTLILTGLLLASFGWYKNFEKSSGISIPTDDREMITKIINTIINDPSRLGDSNTEHDMLGNSTMIIDWDTDTQIVYIRPNTGKPVFAIKTGSTIIADIDFDAKRLVIKKLTGEMVKPDQTWHQQYKMTIKRIHQKIIAVEIGPGP